MSRKRKLRPDERDLWNQVAKTAVPLSPVTHSETVIEDNKLAPPVRDVPEEMPEIPMFRVGERARGSNGSQRPTAALPQSLATTPVHMDKKAFTRLKRGKLKPEARIDLHGMTLAQAHPALSGFILRAHGEGKRLVLVITGKGKQSEDTGPIPRQRGILRHQVPQWLRMAPLSGLILQVSESHLRHGGSGAYYVYLRRGR